MEVGKLVVGLVIMVSITYILASWGLPVNLAGGDELLVLCEVCACSARPYNTTLVVRVKHLKLLERNTIVFKRLVPPLCCNVSIGNNGLVAYECPAVFMSAGERLNFSDWILLKLFSIGNGTCIVTVDQLGQGD